MGFSAADEQILKIICFYLQMRLERRAAMKEVKKREQQVVHTLRLTSEICTQRHHQGLFRKMRANLPAFFGFEAVGVLMYDFEKLAFFTDGDTGQDDQKADDDSSDESENENQSMDSDIANKKKKQPQYQKEDKPLTEAQKAEKIRAIHSAQFTEFPTNSGISGHVFKHKEIYWSKDA